MLSDKIGRYCGKQMYKLWYNVITKQIYITNFAVDVAGF